MLELMEPYLEIECGITLRAVPLTMPSDAAQRLQAWVEELRDCGSLLMVGECARHRVEGNLRRVLEARRSFQGAWAHWRARLASPEALAAHRQAEEARLALEALHAREEEERNAEAAREADKQASAEASAVAAAALG